MTLSAQAQPAQTDAALERILRLARRLLGISWVWLSGPDGEVLAGARPLEPALEPNGAALYSLEHQEWGKLAQLGLSDHPSPLSDALEEDIRDLCALLLEVLVQRQEHLWSASTLEHAPQPAFAVDLGGRVRRFNPAALHLFRLNTEEVMGQLFERIPTLSSPLLNVVYSQALSGQEVRPLELPCFRSDGTVVLLRFSLAPLLDARGRIRGVVFCADDLLASLEDSNEREALRRLYAGVLDHLPLELTLMDSEERIIYLTPAMVPDPKVRRSVQGLHREQVSRTLGRSEEQLEHWKGRFEAVRRSHKAVQWEETAADTQGLRSMLRCIQPVLSAQGEIEMFIGYSLDLTEQKQAQLEREQALQLYQSLFDNATEGIYQSTPQGTMLRANPALVRFNGYQTEAELLEAVQDIAVEWYVEVGRREEFMRQLEVHGQVTLFESEVYCHKTGERVWISESARAVRGESGQVLYFEGTVQDITARKVAQLEREEALSMFRSLFENATEGIYRIGRSGFLLWANPALVRLNGFGTEAQLRDSMGENPASWYVNPQRLGEFMSLLERDSRLEGFESEVYLSGTGERRWIVESAREVRDEFGRGLYIEGTVQDITARKEAELEREKAALVYKQLFENIPHPIYRSTPDGRMIASNPALVRFNGYNSEAEQIAAVQVGMGKWYVDPSRYSLFRDLLERNGEVHSLESEVYRHRSGERTWVSESAWAVRDDSGRVLYYEGIVQDMSARKEAELEREQALSMYRSLFENATEGIYQTDADGQMVRANPALVRANNGQSEAELLEQVRLHGEQWYALPGRREEFRALLAQFGRVDALESEVIPYGSSERRWVSESAWSVFDDSGHFLYYEGFVQDITARKGVEAQLEAEKRLLEGVVKTSPNPIFLRTATAQMVLVNPALLAVNNQTEQEFYSGEGQIHPNNPAEFAQWLENDRIMLERGEVMTFEEQFTLLSGEVKVYSTVKAPFRRDDGEVLVLGISSDVTELRRSEAWLRRIEQAVESVSDSILIFEAGKLVFANKTALEQCGYSLEQLQHGALFKMAPPEVMLPLLESLEHQERFQGETMLQAADGRDVTVLIRSSRIRDAAGEWIGSVVTMTNISERRRMEDELRLIRRAFESSSEAIMVSDEAFRPLFINPAVQEQTGYNLKELQNGAMDVIGSSEQNGVIIQNLLERDFHSGEGVLRDSRGRFIQVLIRANRIRGEHGQVLGSVMVASDITERKRIEGLKDDFVATVSHELRTPLTSISGALGLLAAGVLGEISAEQRPMLDIAHQNAERLITLVGDLLDMQKMEGEGLSLSTVPLELESVLEQTLLEMTPYANTLGVLLTLEPMTFVDGLRKRVSGDRGRLFQVLSNLISNACKFSSAGQTVRVRLLELPGTLRVEVEDAGSGIPEAFQSQIFQKFAQADISSTRAKGGTGLGLAISKAIVERHGGQIGFRTLTVGTLFYFELPQLEG